MVASHPEWNARKARKVLLWRASCTGTPAAAPKKQVAKSKLKEILLIDDTRKRVMEEPYGGHFRCAATHFSIPRVISWNGTFRAPRIAQNADSRRVKGAMAGPPLHADILTDLRYSGSEAIFSRRLSARRRRWHTGPLQTD
jgi:hypothetical protein